MYKKTEVLQSQVLRNILAKLSIKRWFPFRHLFLI